MDSSRSCSESRLRDSIIDHVFEKLTLSGLPCEMLAFKNSRRFIQVRSEKNIPFSDFACIGDRVLFVRDGERRIKNVKVAVVTNISGIESFKEMIEKESEDQIIFYVNGIDHNGLGEMSLSVAGAIWIKCQKDPVLMPKSNFRAIKDLNTKIDRLTERFDDIYFILLNQFGQPPPK